MPSLAGVFKLRYLVLLLGIFSTFTGFIYNDLVAIPLYLFPSCFDGQTGARHPQCVYPVGVDPAWHTAGNELQFLNSLKMKIAVILGVLQMSLGVFLKACNALFHKNKVDFLHEFVPQILVLWALFGYMDVLIIRKWLTDYTFREAQAPSIIAVMINMALNGGRFEQGQALIASEATNQAISNVLLGKSKRM